jgi:hypothetical protein
MLVCESPDRSDRPIACSFKIAQLLDRQIQDLGNLCDRHSSGHQTSSTLFKFAFSTLSVIGETLILSINFSARSVRRRAKSAIA